MQTDECTAARIKQQRQQQQLGALERRVGRPKRKEMLSSADDALAGRWLGTAFDCIALRLAENEVKDFV